MSSASPWRARWIVVVACNTIRRRIDLKIERVVLDIVPTVAEFGKE